MTDPKSLREALACADGTCGHHPQFDCDKHHPNSTLAAAYRESQARVKELARNLAQQTNDVFAAESRAEKAEAAVSRWEKGMGLGAWNERMDKLEAKVQEQNALKLRAQQRAAELEAKLSAAEKDAKHAQGVIETYWVPWRTRAEDAESRLTASLAREEKMRSPEMMERLAAIEHERWSGWMRHLFSKCVFVKHPESVASVAEIPVWAVERWMRQMNTSYERLTEEEKESDRAEVRKTLAALLSAPETEGEGTPHTPEGGLDARK